MPNIPVPCTNCLRFHYGRCYEAPKQCYKCGGFNHIERYCPHERRVQNDPGEPLPGTRAWCAKRGLDSDPELRQKVLDAIKTSPGCAIWVNNLCIYGGKQRYFASDDQLRGFTPDGHATRRRSRSPPSDKFRQRSISPARGRGSSQGGNFASYASPPRIRSPSPYRPRRYRSRSPIRRRSPSPYWRFEPLPPSSRYSRDAYVPVYEGRGSSARGFAQNPNSYRPRSRSRPRYLTGPQLSSFQPESRAPLSNITNTHNAATQQPAEESAVPQTPRALVDYPSDPEPMQSTKSQETHVIDPYFVLGVVEGAKEQEICDAYIQRMWDIEMAKSAEGNDRQPKTSEDLDIFEESIKILNAARKQVIGY